MLTQYACIFSRRTGIMTSRRITVRRAAILAAAALNRQYRQRTVQDKCGPYNCYDKPDSSLPMVIIFPPEEGWKCHT